MKIFIQEIQDDLFYEEKLDFLAERIYFLKREFVMNRLLPIDIDLLEEEENGSLDSCYILLKMSEPNVRDFIYTFGYSRELKDKINLCFSVQDFQVLEEQIRVLKGIQN